jgi:phosphoglycerate dehydrogenase-like enzyme
VTHPPILVVSAPDDDALKLLQPPPPGERLVIGWNPAELMAAAPEAEILVSCSASKAQLEPLFRAAPKLRWMHSLSAGLDTLLFPALAASPVVLTNARGVYSASLGEWVMASVLFFAKELRRLVRSQERGVWDIYEPQWVRGKTLGIIGYGDIGRASAQLARAFGMNVLAVRRSPAPDPLCDEVLGLDRMRDVMARSDYVVVVLPLTPETHHLVGAAEIAAMKPGGVFINIGRGPVVEETPLVEALRAGRIRGAALDVFEQEPVPAGHPLYSLPNVLFSAHCADRVPTWRTDSMQVFLDNLKRYRSGQPLLNVIDKSRGY